MPNDVSDHGQSGARPAVEVNERGWPILRPANRVESAWSQRTGIAVSWDRLDDPEMS